MKRSLKKILRSKIFYILLFLVTLITPFLWKYNINIVFGENDIKVHKMNFFDELVLIPQQKENYKFNGYYLNDEKVTYLHHNIGNKTIEARYEPKRYSVLYMPGDDLDKYNNLVTSYTYGELTKLPALHKEHCEFLGYLSNGNLIHEILPGTSGMLNLDPMFKPEEYTINYELNGGELKDPITSYKYGIEPELNNPTKDGYVFKGYYLDQNFKNPYQFNKEMFGDITLYAYYVKPETINNITSIDTSNMSGTYIVCGNYAANLYSSSWPSTEEVQAIVDGPGAWHDYTDAGVEYVADHSHQGANSFINNSSLYIHRADGTIDYYVKNYSISGSYAYDNSWVLDNGFSPQTTADGDLMTQTCSGSVLTFTFWYKQ